MRRALCRYLLTAVVAFAVVSGAASASAQTPPPPTNGPDFTNVSDMLQGRRRLLPVDDLVVTSPTGAGGAVSNLVALTNDQSTQDQSSYAVTAASSAFATGAGRMLNIARDVIVTMGSAVLTVRDQNPGGRPVTSAFSISGSPAGLTMADLNSDGFADVALLTANSAGATSGLLRIVSPNDPNDLGAGLFVSDGVSPTGIDFSRPISITSASLYGDGTRQVVIAQPTAASGTRFTVQIYRVVLQSNGAFASQALALAASGTFGSYQSQPLLALAVLAGNFDASISLTGGLPQQELAVATHAGANLVVHGFQVSTATTSPITLVSTFPSIGVLATSGPNVGPLVALATPFDRFSGADQIAVGYTDVTNNVLTQRIAMFVADSPLNWSQPNAHVIEPVPLVAIAAGNFDKSLGTNSAPNLQLAVVTPNQGSPGYSLPVLNVEPQANYGFTFGSIAPILPGVPFDAATPFAIASGDFQGRSMLLGPPSRITILQHQQPQVVIAAPPMHVDWITPDGVAPPAVFNVSAVPNGFTASYQTAQVGTQQSSSTGTTSFTYGTKQSSEVDVSFGVPEVASVSGSLSAIAAQTHEAVVSSVFDTYQGSAFDASTQTSFDDRLWWASKRFNVYVYPVIGRCIPCADASACTVPMEVREDHLRQLEFALEVDRAVLSRFPALCAAPRPWTTQLTTTFAIDDGARPPVLASASPAWECVGADPAKPGELRR